MTRPAGTRRRTLAELDLDEFRAGLVEAVGEPLASELFRAVTSDGPPDPETLARWRRRLRWSRAELLWRPYPSHACRRDASCIGSCTRRDSSSRSSAQTDRGSRPWLTPFRKHAASSSVARAAVISPPECSPGRVRLLRREASDSSEPHAREPHGRGGLRCSSRLPLARRAHRACCSRLRRRAFAQGWWWSSAGFSTSLSTLAVTVWTFPRPSRAPSRGSCPAPI